jgi:DNA-binding transcriptional MocR family regulator
LLYLLDKMGVACPLAPGHRLPLSQATVAAVTGVARQTVNRALRDLQALGLIHLEREVLCVLDRSALKAFAQGRRLKHTRAPVGDCEFAHPAAPLLCHPPRFIPVTLVPLTLRRFVEA